MSKPVPIDKDLYKFVVSLANKKFDSPSGIYRSSWIVREYKKLGDDCQKRADIDNFLQETEEKIAQLMKEHNDQKVKVSGGVFDNNDYINQLVKPPKFECDLLSEELQIFPSEMVSTCISQEYVEKKVSVQNFRKYLVGQLSNLPLELNNYCYKQPKCNG